MEQLGFLIIAITIILCIFCIITVMTSKNNLDGIKSKTVGDGQHGVARFATKREIKNTYKHISFNPNEWRKGEIKNLPQGLVVGSIKHGKKVTAIVDTDDVHCLMIGSAGVGKTAFFLYPNIEYACASGMSFISTDTKGDVLKNYGYIAKEVYGYNVSVIDLRNPTHSDGNNLLQLVNKYTDIYLLDKNNLTAKAKAEKYAKIIAKTIIATDNQDKGANSYFYDCAEGLLTAMILIVSEFIKPSYDYEKRHIVSVYKLLQELLAPDPLVKNKSKLKTLLEKLPANHKARWYAGATLNTSEQAMYSIISTVLSRLNGFLDTELESILCFNSSLDAEKFASEKSAIFLVFPEENPTTNFIISLFIQQYYRELLTVADDNGGTLPNRVVMLCDELGTIPKIESFELMLSAGRSRKISVVPIIQSFAQLRRNYGNEGSEIIVDNTQLVIFSGFAPNSETAQTLSKALGNKTVLSGSVSTGKSDPSQSLQMIERPLMTADELKGMAKGDFIVMKTANHPMRTKLQLYFKWGITFDNPFIKEKNKQLQSHYATVSELEKNISKLFDKHKPILDDSGISIKL